jgi:hypothetical protein
VVTDGFSWNGTTYRSLSEVARAISGTNWNGPRFFGLLDDRKRPGHAHEDPALRHLHPRLDRARARAGFNSLDNQREASKDYVKSQAHEAGGPSRPATTMAASPAAPLIARPCSASWPTSGPALSMWWWRLTRSLSGFAKLVELFDQTGVSCSGIERFFRLRARDRRFWRGILQSRHQDFAYRY